MKKRVLFVIESLSGGGAEKVLTTIVKNIDKTKFDITVLTVVKIGVYVEEVEKYCTLISMLPEYEKLTNPIDKIKYKVDYRKIYKEDCAKIYKKYVKNVYDVEIAFVEGFVTKLVASSWNRNSKKIAWVHVDLIQRAYADEYFLNNEEHKTCYKKYDKVICVSKSVLDVYKQKFDLENGTVCYNPVDSHELKKYKKEYQIQDKLKICCVGRLEDQKGFDRLIKILGKLKLKNYVVDIYGIGTMKDELDKMIQKYGLEDSVRLKGFQKNIYEAMSNYHLLISPSRAEGFSLVVAEAMCMGIPVLSTDCAGPNELTDYGKYGILVENSDEALENAIQNIFEKKEALYKYHKLSEERSNIFKIENVMKEVEGNIYE